MLTWGFLGFVTLHNSVCHFSGHWDHVLSVSKQFLFFLKVHLTPKYFFRPNKSLHLFETQCAFLPLFNPNLDFLQAVKVTKSDHHLLHDRASKGYGSIPGWTSQTNLHACSQRLNTMQISLRKTPFRGGRMDLFWSYTLGILSAWMWATLAAIHMYSKRYLPHDSMPFVPLASCFTTICLGKLSDPPRENR